MQPLGLMLLCLVIGVVTAENSGYAYNRAGASNLPVRIGLPAPAHVSAPTFAAAPVVTNEVNKEFYTYSAPEAEFAQPEMEQLVNEMKKNLQVIFIHAPQQTGLNRALENFAQHRVEQQTAIYVLTKQADLPQLNQLLNNNHNHVVHKPEVHFVKYRTPEDAAHAQQSIRAHYDALGGQSRHSEEGVAPVINFASQPQVTHGHSGAHEASGTQSAHHVHTHTPSQNYLPVRF